LPIGNLAAQITHAAGESSPGNLPPKTFAVVLGVDRDDLVLVHKRLKKHGIEHELIIENDPPYRNQLMAIGIVPCPKKCVYPYLRDLRLLGKKK